MGTWVVNEGPDKRVQGELSQLNLVNQCGITNQRGRTSATGRP